MFFARLAVAALTFGSFARVLSAPIVVDTLPAPVEAAAGRIQNLPRDGPLNFLDALSKVDNAVQEASTIIGSPNVDTALVSGALSKLDFALGSAAGVLDAPGSDVASIRQDVDGVTTLTTEAVAGAVTTAQIKIGELVVKVVSLKTVNVAVTQVQSIKFKLIQIHAGLIKFIPQIAPFVESKLVETVGLIDTGLQGMGVTVDA